MPYLICEYDFKEKMRIGETHVRSSKEKAIDLAKEIAWGWSEEVEPEQIDFEGNIGFTGAGNFGALILSVGE